jgi:hypothetical protein
VGAAFGVITGIAMGVMEYRHAAELEDLRGALMNPEQIVSRAEVEIEMFVAQLGLALAVVAALPEVKAAVAAATKATRAIAEEGARAALKRIAVEAIDAELGITLRTLDRVERVDGTATEQGLPGALWIGERADGARLALTVRGWREPNGARVIAVAPGQAPADAPILGSLPDLVRAWLAGRKA